MKRFLFTTFALCSFVVTYSQKEPSALKITDNLYVATGIWCNATFYVADDQVYVFDCGWNIAQGKTLMSQIKQVTDKKVKTLVYTHSHWDHTMGACALPEGIEIIAHENLKANLKRDEKNIIDERENIIPEKILKLERELARNNEPDTIKAKKKQELEDLKNKLTEHKERCFRFPTVSVKDTVIIKTGNEIIRIIKLGNAHLDDDCIIEFEKSNAVYMGDILFSNCYPNIGWNAGADIENWKKILISYAQKDFEYYIPGHCEMANSKDLLSLADYLNDMEKAVEKEIKQGKTLVEIQNSMPKLEKFKHYGFDFFWPQNIEAFYNLLKDK